ncbi:hypothetical protein V5799_000037 [Amblyomma americanum]|uniref:Uncharacterized protein n=1 Tax=Amblyomma americanum TaxID=6943 RepID=A0AAQ4D472_AMBAM
MVVPEISEEDDEDSPSNADEGCDDEDPGGPLSKRSSSSLWTLLGRRSSSSGSLHDAESGLLQPPPADSTLHVYFKGSDAEQQEAAKQKHLLQLPEDRRRTGRLGSEPSPAVGQRSFLRELFHAKPALRVQAWTGAGGDYGSPPKRPRKPRTKVSFSADAGSKPHFHKTHLRHRSRSTSDLAAILETARKEALLSSLASLKAAMPRRKSLESCGPVSAKEAGGVRRCNSLPELNISDADYNKLLTPEATSIPKKPVRGRTSLTPQSSLTPKVSEMLQLKLTPRPPALTLRKSPTPQRPPESTKPPQPSDQARQALPTPTVVLSPPPAPAPPEPPQSTPAAAEATPALAPAAETQVTTSPEPSPAETSTKERARSSPPKEKDESSSSPVEITLRRPRVHLPRLVVPKPRSNLWRSAMHATEESSDGQVEKEAATSASPGKPSSSLATPSAVDQPPVEPQHTRPRLRVRVVPEPEIIPIETTDTETPPPSSAEIETGPPGASSEPLPEPPPSLPPEPPDRLKEEDLPSTTEPSTKADDEDKAEFVVVIQEPSDDRPKQLIILKGPPDRAGSVDSLLGDPRPKAPKRRSSVDSPVAPEEMRKPVFTPQRKQPPAEAPKPTEEPSGADTAPPEAKSSQTEAGRRQRRRRRSSAVRRESVATSHEGSPPSTATGSQESLSVAAAAAPVHRRVPSEVLMRWQNVAPSDSVEELDRPPPPPLLELPGAVLPPPRGHVRQLSRVFSHRSSSTSSSVTVRTSTTSLSRARTKAEAFLASEKRQS